MPLLAGNTALKPAPREPGTKISSPVGLAVRSLSGARSGSTAPGSVPIKCPGAGGDENRMTCRLSGIRGKSLDSLKSSYMTFEDSSVVRLK
jgi:hypothetical protein